MMMQIMRIIEISMRQYFCGTKKVTHLPVMSNMVKN